MLNKNIVDFELNLWSVTKLCGETASCRPLWLVSNSKLCVCVGVGVLELLCAEGD